ncbi:hypothetical protein EYC80_005824 [Monilinia laxa]|uniref:Uncharacterized protein n=1 Tax=Monilinia laxa TaxID=61186 RepID=A0A5N6KF65_MONLA|nr:hypothetical protein EYC80_005824 [Monilinia laxa]
MSTSTSCSVQMKPHLSVETRTPEIGVDPTLWRKILKQDVGSSRNNPSNGVKDLTPNRLNHRSEYQLSNN